MTPGVRNLCLTAHVCASVGWLGALAVFLAHAMVSVTSQEVQLVRAAALAMSVTTWFVIMPLSLASLTTGLVQALGSAWGLFRHYWIVFKLLLTSIATIVLLLKIEPISYLAGVATAAAFSTGDLMGLRTSLLVHAIGGLLVLLAASALAVYKPAGMTRYGARKQREENAGSVRSGPVLRTSTPRWVRAFGAAIVVLILLVGIMMLVGGHGPGAHMPAGS
jgi:hypothetical protein